MRELVSFIKGADGVLLATGARCSVRVRRAVSLHRREVIGPTWARARVVSVQQIGSRTVAYVRTKYLPLRCAESGELKAWKPRGQR